MTRMPFVVSSQFCKLDSNPRVPDWMFVKTRVRGYCKLYKVQSYICENTVWDSIQQAAFRYPRPSF